jgi:hypothetical protein
VGGPNQKKNQNFCLYYLGGHAKLQIPMICPYWVLTTAPTRKEKICKIVVYRKLLCWRTHFARTKMIFFSTKFPFQALLKLENHVNSKKRNTIVGQIVKGVYASDLT